VAEERNGPHRSRNPSTSSNFSFGEGSKGISIGAGRAVSAVSKDVETVGNLTGSDGESAYDGKKKKK
jgi:lysosomal acid lipase/cholesteryl ester hydrolase